MSTPELEAESRADEGEQKEKPRLNLDVRIDKPGACQRHITVTVSRDDVDRYLNEAYSELLPKAEVPGFRPGRAPRKLVESRFRKQVSEQVKASLLMDSLEQITKEHEFSAISEPEIDLEAIELPEESPFTFEFDLEVRPEFDPPQWKGLTLKRPVYQFTKRDVDRLLEQQLGQEGRHVDKDGPAEADDFVVVQLVVRHQGDVVTRRENVVLRLRPELSFADGRLDGFAQLMQGVRGGDSRSATVTIGHDAPNEALQGQDVQLELHVRQVQRLELPQLDEPMLQHLGQFATEGDLRDALMDQLNNQLRFHQQQSVRKQITDLLTEAANWDLPPELVRRQTKREMDRVTMDMRSAGFSEEEIRARENELRRDSLAATRTALKEHFILERIAEDEEIDVTPEDYDLEIARIAAHQREPVRRVRARFEKRGLMDVLRNQILERKVIDRITAHARFMDVEYQPEEKKIEAVDFYLSGRGGADIPVAKYAAEAEELPLPRERE